MKPSEVGFDGSFYIKTSSYIPLIRLARSMDKDKGPDVWSTCVKKNINGKITNTFIWWGKEEDEPELFYRNKEGKLFTVNFEPWEEINDQ